ncbi:hypothetical protein ACQR0V_04920 [Bradyrhizobium sp. HKCCYLS2058]
MKLAVREGRAKPIAVMAGLAPAIHDQRRTLRDVDARHEAGNDDNCEFAS